MDIQQLTIASLQDKLKKKEVSSVEVTRAYLETIEKSNQDLNAYITVTKDEALKEAQKVDALIADNDEKIFIDKPLLGVPYALKDIFLSEGIKTTAASKVLENYIAQYDGTAVTRIKNSGAILLGKTNLDAWAHGSSGENSDFGATKNPYNTAYVPGGSSSGSPVAVAANMALMATGTDTGGSIRLPASFTNTVGLKPTYGRVSRYGVMAMASSLDSIGHFTNTVEDNARVLAVTAGKDSMDATTPDIPVPDYSSTLRNGVKGLTIGIPKEYFGEGIDPKVQKIVQDAIDFYQSEGAEIKEVSLPHTKYAVEVYYILQTAEVSSNLARYTGLRYGKNRNAFGDEAKRRIMLGTFVLSSGHYDAFYKKALQVRTLLKRDFDTVFESVDILLTPTSPTLPWKLGEKTDDPLKMYLSDILTVHANLVGIPGLVVPAGFVDGLPVGIQLLGKYFDEATLYKAGYAFEQANPYWKERPKL